MTSRCDTKPAQNERNRRFGHLVHAIGRHIDSYVALYMIKHINKVKLIWWVIDISNCGQEYVTYCLIIKVIYNLDSGHIRRLLGLLAKMGLQSHIDSFVALCMIKHIKTAKLTWCVHYVSNCGKAYLTICLIIKVVYNFTTWHLRRLIGLPTKMGV